MNDKAAFSNDLEAYYAFLRQDFLAFTEKVFATLNPGISYKPNWHHQVIAHELAEVMAGRSRRLILNLPPRYLKSIMVSVALPAYVLGHFPEKRFVCASYGKELAIALSRDCRTVMGSDWYKAVFPNTRIATAPDTDGRFDTTKRGYRLATSVGGPLTGMGGDYIVIDDPTKPTDAYSDTARQATLDWFNKTVSSRLDDPQTGAMIVVMQRLHVDDLSGHLLRGGGWKLVSIPATARDTTRYDLGGNQVYLRPEGAVLQPERETSEDLKRLRRQMSSAVFEAQYQQNPVPEEGAQLKREWFRYFQTEPPATYGRVVYQSWDTAFTAKNTADWSVCTTWAVEDDHYYLLDVLRVKLLYPDLKRVVIEHARRYRARSVLIEDKGSGQILVQEFQRSGELPVIPCQPKGDKVVRLMAVTPLFEAGCVRFRPGAEWLDDLENELLQFPNGAHDDQVDSISQFLNYMEERKIPDMAIYHFDGRWLQ